jgi:MFS family permease
MPWHLLPGQCLPRRLWPGPYDMRNRVFNSKRFGGLWRHPDFLKLWGGQTISQGGSLVSHVALPLVAILTLQASPAEVALLRIADLVPSIVIGLFAGVWVDRMRRRPLMIWADLGRAVLLGSIPAAALLGLLGMSQLLIVAFVAGLLTALFEVAYHAYVPTLISRAELVEGNSKLEASGATIEVAAFGLSGWLVQLLTAPIAVLVDALSFLVSALGLGAIRTAEPAAEEPAADQTTWRAIREGLDLVRHWPVLRALAGAQATLYGGIAIWLSMFLLFLSRDLELQPSVYGMVFGIGGICSLIGATFAERVERRLGLGLTMIVTLFLMSAGLLMVPLAGGPFWLIVVLVSAQQVSDAAGTMYLIHERSLIQATVPSQSLGRVTASLRVIGWIAMLVGTILGGLLGESIGPRATLFVGAAVALPSTLWLVWSPVRSLRQMPMAVEG